MIGGDRPHRVAGHCLHDFRAKREMAGREARQSIERPELMNLLKSLTFDADTGIRTKRGPVIVFASKPALVADLD